ncbi:MULTISPECIES: DUF4394 domain-containing protein [unclassified Leptolyngbya]|uniref:DUF4394 domain-containing protein n=1 Tax=unclassified Leptolyngbya TaxID=2650499 RepID=UPI001686F906|nr:MULTISPECIES: DUF4394 domain-containing protein [unclassified Leptolyngbya]MBD1909316.1 DUF4394 domain-containing protein [Leptolyngbya sp. FACHB-8]MBD2153546.1 DUF4394 domain-containing protein [Leptolyngbya sp. FACHB-16]
MAFTLGTTAANNLTGTPENDTIYGGAGNDTIYGGAGDDRLSGNGTVRFVGLNNNTLTSFSIDNPAAVTTTAISGVDGTLLGIDVRPANGLIYGLSSTNKLYTINALTGAAALVSTLSVPFEGGAISGFDFNPVADRLRLVGSNDQSFRVNVDTGAVIVDGTLAYDPADTNNGENPTVAAAAYLNSFAGSTTTQLFNIDIEQDTLVLQNPPNNGVLTTIGELGVNFDSLSGFDILSFNNGVNTAYAVSNSTLYSIDLATGAATSLGAIGNGTLSLQGLVALTGNGGIGNNVLSGGAGNDELMGGSNRDTLSGGDGNDLLDGGAGNDSLSGETGVDALFGGAGFDTLDGGGDNDILDGGTSNDVVRGGNGRDLLKGGQGNDILNGGEGDDVMLGGQGNDLLNGLGGNDYLLGDGGLQMVALTDANTLIAFNPNSPGSSQQIQVTGVDGNLLGIDVRPANGLIYGLSSTNKLYTIDANTGAATLASTLNMSFEGGTVSGFDFNPVADRLRLVGGNGQNYRINVETGEVTVDTAIAYAPTDSNTGLTPNVTAAAYTNAFAGTTATQLYNIAAAQDVLVLQNPPNDGALTTIGSLGIDFDNLGGFDILSTANGLNLAFAVSDSTLYTIDLATGAASRLGQIGGALGNIVGLTSSILPNVASGLDRLNGGDGNDTLDGGRGIDFLNGGNGGDRLVGGAGLDRLTGGNGSDTFVFKSDTSFNTANLGVDVIKDFNRSFDRIELSQATFGTLTAAQVQVVNTNSAAARSSGLIIYSRASGNLYFNENGAAAGFGDGGQFARLLGQPGLTANNVQIVA